MVYHWVMDIMTMSTTVTILTLVCEEFMKEDDRLAPKTLEFWTCSASSAVRGPMES